MNVFNLTFPLTVDFGTERYWIGAEGPFKYGEAVTAFLCGEDGGTVDKEYAPLVQELEEQLLTLGSHLEPFAKDPAADMERYAEPERHEVSCSVCAIVHHIERGGKVMAERYTFSALRDFLHVELGKAIVRGSAPRQCRLCGQWFLHEQGSLTVYCGRIAPGEEYKTCRETGARAVFEKKIREDDTWKIYKRAYKKYYARYMKKNMSESEFKTWAAQAAAERDAAIERMETAADENLKVQIIEQLRKKLNQK